MNSGFGMSHNIAVGWVHYAAHYALCTFHYALCNMQYALCTLHYAAGVTINCPSIMLMLPLSPDQQIEDRAVSMSVTLPIYHQQAKTGSRQNRITPKKEKAARK